MPPDTISLASGQRKHRVLLINPVNELVAVTSTGHNWFNRFRIWKPLGLMVLAGRTPSNWDVEIVDENMGIPDYDAMETPDLVGLSAFTSQANSAYALAERFRARGVPVVMGGVHATVCLDEALELVDCVVTGEADDVWEQVLADAERGELQRVYRGGLADMTAVPAARHDLLSKGYVFGSLQISRGCPLNCSFCSVTVFNGRRLRSRNIPDVIAELSQIREHFFLIADDNLIGTRKEQVDYAKDLFRAMAAAKHGKKWMGQVTINFGDDSELLELAQKAGCFGVLIGFESPTNEGLAEINKRFNTKNGRNLRAAVRRIQKAGIMVCGSFALGLDVDQKGIGEIIAEAGHHYGLDIVNTLFLTPLPGTRLFDKMKNEGRLVAENFPDDWKYYTLTYPVAKYKHLSWVEAVAEMTDVNVRFYSAWRIIGRVLRALFLTRRPLSVIAGLSTALSYRYNRSFENEVAATATIFEDRAPAPEPRQLEILQGA